MGGIDFVDTIVVRRTVEKGTKIVEEKVQPLEWAGQEFKDNQKKLLEKASDRSLSTGKGTKKVLISSLKPTQIPSTSGLGLVTGRGTRIRIGS